MCLFQICFLCILTAVSVRGQNGSIHGKILAKLEYPQYDSGVRPNFDGPPVVVEVDVVLNSVGPVNEMAMTWAASFYLRQEWTDDRLIVPGRSKTVKLDGSNVDKLWMPDLFFSNNKDGRKHHLTVANHVVYLNSSTGRVLYSQRLTVVLNCEMKLVKFPHDNQTCEMKMESYSFTTDDLVLKWSSSRDATSLLPTAFIPDFFIEDISTNDCTATYAIGTYPCLRATVRMHREIGFYVFQTYLPSILIVILSWASFWIDHEAVPARISVGLLTVLTITTQLSGSRAQLPKVPYIKAIDVWMSINLVFVFAAYMEYAVVTVLSRRFKKSQARKSHKDSDGEPRKLSSSEVRLESFTALHSSSPPLTVTNGSADSPTTIFRSHSPVPALLAILDDRDTGRKVDKSSRFCFPLAFAIFNAIYWMYYLLIT